MHLQKNLQNYFTKYESPQTQEGKELLIMLMQAVTANQVLKKYSTEARARCVHQARELKSVRKELEIAKATAKVNYTERMREVKLQQERVRKEEDTLKDTKMKILEILKSCIASGSTNFAEVMRCIDALNTEGLPDLEEAAYTKQLQEKCIGTVRQLEQMKSEYNEMLKATKTELAALHKEMQEIEQSSAKKIAEQEDAMEKLRHEVDAKNKEVETAKANLHQTQKKYDELNDTHLRLRAEFDNYRKRTLREKSELIKNGGESALTHLLPVVDDFERALQNIQKAEDLAAVAEGVNLIYNKFVSYLTSQGVKAMDIVGKPFDADICEAIATIPAPEEGLKGKVIDCVQTGYMLNDKVLRHAKVVVGE